MRPFAQRTSRDEIDGLLERTENHDAAVRVKALRSLCPCHVKRNEPRLWDRILSLVDDPSAKVRSHVFHLLADGSPREREGDVVAAIERLQQDPDKKLRRRARKLIAQYRRGGRINLVVGRWHNQTLQWTGPGRMGHSSTASKARTAEQQILAF